MDLQSLTAIAGIISSLAVVVSLIHASVQLRHNTRALMATTYNAVTANSLALLAPVSGSAEFSEFLHRAQADPASLTSAEKHRFHAFLLTIFRHWDNLYYQFRHGTLDAEMWEIYERTLAHWLANPAWQAWFRENSGNCSNSLQALIRKRLGAAPAESGATASRESGIAFT